MKLTLGKTSETERFQKLAILPHQLFRNKFANTNHFVAMVGVGDDVNVLAKFIEDREIVGCEATEPS